MINEIAITIETHMFSSVYNEFHGDSNSFTNDLEMYLETSYPDAEITVELDDYSDSIWIDGDDSDCIAMKVLREHISQWYGIHTGEITA